MSEWGGVGTGLMDAHKVLCCCHFLSCLFLALGSISLFRQRPGR